MNKDQVMSDTRREGPAVEIDALTAQKQATVRDIEAEILGRLVVARRRMVLQIWLIRIVVLAVILTLWQVASNREWVPSQLVSRPSEIFASFGDYFSTADIWTDVWATFEASLLGLVIGGLLGLLSGVLLAKNETLRRAFKPLITMLNALPRVALAPIFLVWFGLGVTPKVLVAASLVYFVLLLNTVAGLSNVDADISFLSRALAMTRWQRFKSVEFPSALPSIVAGLRLGAVYSVLGVIVSEMVASMAGLGQVLVTATTNLQMGRAFAVIVLITAIATALDVLVSLIERRIRRRHVRGD